MSFISDIFSGSVGGLISSVGDTVAKFVDTPDKKNAMTLELQKTITDRLAMMETSVNTQTQAQSSIIVAELQQGDNFTKRARPTLVYFGMVTIFFNYCFIPLFQTLKGVTVSPFNLPSDFWWAWGGVTGTWSVGRSWEKVNGANGISSIITGSSK